MNPVYPFLSEIHHIVELPVTAFLRRELKEKRVVTWYFDNITRPDSQKPDKIVWEKVWVVSLKDRIQGIDQMLDIGHLGTGQGEGPWCSAENMAAILKRMATTITAAEAKQKMWDHHRNHGRLMNADAFRDYEARLKMYKELKRRHGELHANKFAMQYPVELIDGGPLSVTKAT